jgi:phage regulator Rha-like protein
METLSRIQHLAQVRDDKVFRVSKADMMLLASEYWKGSVPFKDAWTIREELSKKLDTTPQDSPEYISLLQQMVTTYPEAETAMYQARQELAKLRVRKGHSMVRFIW